MKRFIFWSTVLLALSGTMMGMAQDSNVVIFDGDGGQEYIYKKKHKYYVLKDVHGKLKKQYVTVGKIVWGDTMEIKDGLSDTDYIAFAYSKNAKEGVKTQKSSEATS